MRFLIILPLVLLMVGCHAKYEAGFHALSSQPSIEKKEVTDAAIQR